jgi:hypothetical protein
MNDAITCRECSRIYCSLKSYNNHISRNCCKITPIDISCQYCYKTFTRNYNKNLHETSCVKNPNSLIVKQCNEKDNKIQKLEEEIQKLKISVTNQTVVNNGTINITNNTQNIIINNLGNEDISHITRNQMIKLLRMNKECPVEMIKMIHFNSEKPENHNVYKPNFKDKYVKYCDNNIWKIGDLMKIVTELYLSKMDIAEEKFDELKQFLEDSKKDRFQQLLDNREEPEIMGGILKRIIEILYNEKSMITDKLK